MFISLRGHNFRPEILFCDKPDVLTKITAPHMTDDLLEATLKLLVYPRLDEVDENNSRGLPKITYSSFTTHESLAVVPNEQNKIVYPGSISRINMIGVSFNDKEIGEKAFALIKARVPKDLRATSHKENTALEKYYSQYGMKSLVYVGDNTTLIYYDLACQNAEHLIAATLPSLMPYLFKEKPLSLMEKDLLLAIMEETPSRFITLFDTAMKNLKIKERYLEKMLGSFENKLKTAQIDEIESLIRMDNRELERLEESVRAVWERRQRKLDEQRGLIERMEHTQSTELTDFFKCCKNLEFIDATDSSITFFVDNVLSNYDIDMAKDLLKRPNSLFNGGNTIIIYDPYDKQEFINLLKEIFITNRVKVHMGHGFSLNFRDHTYGFIKEINACNLTMNSIYNPHLREYNCLGNNRMILLDQLLKHDYVGAVSTCISATGNLNLAESNNIRNFVNYLKASNAITPFELPNGDRCGIGDALTWVKENTNE